MHMQPLQFIRQFNVESAQYRLHDEQGSEVVLLVDYQHNVFQIQTHRQKPETNFVAEVKNVAKGLLARKHGANLAKREQYL